MAGRVDQVAALAVDERQQEVPAGVDEQAVLAGLLLDRLRGGLHLGPGLRGRGDAGVGEDLLVVEQGQRVGDLGHAVGLAVELVRRHGRGEEVGLVGQQLGAVEAVEVAERGELRHPGDLGAEDVRRAGLGLGGGLELVLGLAEGHRLVIDLDLGIGLVELRDQLFEGRALVLRVRGVPPREFGGEIRRVRGGRRWRLLATAGGERESERGRREDGEPLSCATASSTSERAPASEAETSKDHCGLLGWRGCAADVSKKFHNAKALAAH